MGTYGAGSNRAAEAAGIRKIEYLGICNKQAIPEGIGGGGFVDGWDDPRLPTLKGLRRRGVTPEGIRRFLGELGVFRGNSLVDSGMLDHYIRQDLKERCYNAMAVMKPLKVIITNLSVDCTEMLAIPNHENDDTLGEREVPFHGSCTSSKRTLWRSPFLDFTGYLLARKCV